MPRGPRLDAPGRIFHVMNRGTARRTMFEHPADLRFFLSRLAYSVRRGELDILAYAIMTTHFHLVARSHGHLSNAMRRVQSEYTQHFNRSRGRDGALQRGRFNSKPVSSNLHLANLIPYVDENPVGAGLVERPQDYPWGSAFAWANGEHRQWLSDDLVHLRRPLAGAETRSARAAFIEARLAGRGLESAYESLVSATPEHVASWMKERAALADGTGPGLPIAGVATVERMVRVAVSSRRDVHVLVPGGRRHRTDGLLRAGLLRELAGLSFAHVARILETSDARAKRLYTHHQRCVEQDTEYRMLAASVVVACLDVLVQPTNRQTLV